MSGIAHPVERPTYTDDDIIIHQSGQIINVLIKSTDASRQQGSEDNERERKVPHGASKTRARRDTKDFHLAPQVHMRLPAVTAGELGSPSADDPGE